MFIFQSSIVYMEVIVCAHGVQCIHIEHHQYAQSHDLMVINF